MKNERGEQLVEHHVKYVEIHGNDETILMTKSEHSKLHIRLRKDGKCNVPPDKLQKISKAAHNRTDKQKEYHRIYQKKNGNKNMALISVDDKIYDSFRKWVSDKYHGRTYGEIKRESEIALQNHMNNLTINKVVAGQIVTTS